MAIPIIQACAFILMAVLFYAVRRSLREGDKPAKAEPKRVPVPVPAAAVPAFHPSKPLPAKRPRIRVWHAVQRTGRPLPDVRLAAVKVFPAPEEAAAPPETGEYERALRRLEERIEDLQADLAALRHTLPPLSEPALLASRLDNNRTIVRMVRSTAESDERRKP